MTSRNNQVLAIDWLLIVPVLYLLTIGFVVLQSLASAGNELVDMQSQAIAIGVGLVLMILIRQTSLLAFLRAAPAIYAVSIALLGLVLVLGQEIQGSERWIQLAGQQFQPSEMAKLAVILIVARLLAIRRDAINLPLSFSVVLLYAALPAVLVVLQPDLGTAITLFLIWLAVLSVSRLQSRFMGLLIAIMVATTVLTMPLLADYQRERITSFINQGDDPLGANYNVLQSEIAVGSGGLLGKGLEAGSQSQYNFLPSAHTDFIFAVTAEKLGIIGALSILVACVLIILRGIMIAWSSESEFGRYIATGIVVVLLLQVVVNVGMNIGLMPVTGLPLPLMSFGGTHIVVELVMIGFLMSVGRQSKM